MHCAEASKPGRIALRSAPRGRKARPLDCAAVWRGVVAVSPGAPGGAVRCRAKGAPPCRALVVRVFGVLSSLPERRRLQPSLSFRFRPGNSKSKCGGIGFHGATLRFR